MSTPSFLLFHHFNYLTLIHKTDRTQKDKSLFGTVVLVTLFKYCKNMYGEKSVVKIQTMLFKQRKWLSKPSLPNTPKTFL